MLRCLYRGWCISSSTEPRGITISSPCTLNLIWNRSKDVLINSIEREFYKLKTVLCTHSIHSNDKFRSSTYKLTIKNPTRSLDFQISVVIRVHSTAVSSLKWSVFNTVSTPNVFDNFSTSLSPKFVEICIFKRKKIFVEWHPATWGNASVMKRWLDNYLRR